MLELFYLLLLLDPLLLAGLIGLLPGAEASEIVSKSFNFCLALLDNDYTVCVLIDSFRWKYFTDFFLTFTIAVFKLGPLALKAFSSLFGNILD